MNKKSISIFCAILMIIGTALPWTSMQATSSFFDSETSLSGLKFTEGILGLIAAIAGIGLVYFNHPYSIFAGIVNIILGGVTLFAHDMFGSSFSYDLSNLGGDEYGLGEIGASFVMSPGIGIWIFIGSAILFTLLTIKISKQNVEKKEN